MKTGATRDPHWHSRLKASVFHRSDEPYPTTTTIRTSRSSRWTLRRTTLSCNRDPADHFRGKKTFDGEWINPGWVVLIEIEWRFQRWVSIKLIDLVSEGCNFEIDYSSEERKKADFTLEKFIAYYCFYLSL